MIMNKQEELFYQWMNLKEKVRTLTDIIQNPLDRNCITSIDLAEWKDQCICFEEKYSNLKQKTEEFITMYLMILSNGQIIKLPLKNR